MGRQLKTLILLSILLLSSKSVYATHIMGGDLTYRYISNDSFEFTLAFYVDCVNGNPGAIASDKFAILGFFNAKTKNFIDKVEIERNQPERVSKLNYACVTPPPNACVDRYEYIFSKRVKVGEDGIIVAFQRCCRNHTITNLVDPGGTGMTLIATIPSKSTVQVNSNPVFKDSPPNFLCNDAPLVFDHSATDLDSDSLVYDLYLPFEGANPNSPRPSQPSNPDYDPVAYTASYNLSNLMGGSEKLKINRKTGELTVIPDKIGQYVVGIRVSEYRNGVRIGETLRDYQFNVLACDIKISANFDLPVLKCSDSVVALNNTSRDGKDYHWEISKQNVVVKTSEDKSPTITINKKGNYKIKLIATNDQCSDSIAKNIDIGEIKIIDANFSIELDDTCSGAMVYITNKSDITPHWYWDLGLGAGEQRNINVNQLQITEAGIYTIRLRISDTANCAIDDMHEVQFEILGRDTLVSDFSHQFPEKCEPGTLVLTKIDEIETDWIWDIDGVPHDDKNKVSITLEDLSAGNHTITLKHEKSVNPCVVILPKSEAISADSLIITSELLNVYNVFTPNDDGINDCYQLDMKNADCYEVVMHIYNRWGELVFHTENALIDCWNGKQSNGEYYPAGTYFGIVNLKHQESDASENIPITITFIH
jgi:gliding motility-associated-like protein